MVRLPLVLNPTYILPNSRKNLNENIFNIIEPLNNKLHGLLPPWWFSLSPWRICITFVWQRGSPKLPVPSSQSECHIHIYMAFRYGFCIDKIVHGFVFYHRNGKCLLQIQNNRIWTINSRCLMVSADQADPTCFYFRISWILMEQRWFYFFRPLHLLQGLRSNNIK